MADSEKTLKIEIDLAKTGSGDTDAAAGLRKIKIETGDLNDETKRSLNLLPPLEENLKKGGKAAKEAGISHSELGKTLLEIGNVAAPGAGHALNELAFGPVGAAQALIGAFEMVRKTIEAVEKEEEALNDENLTEHQASIKNIQTAWDDAATEFGKYLAKISHAGEGEDAIKKQIERAKELVTAELEGQLKIQEALGKTETARLRASGATPEQIAAAEARNQEGIDYIQSSLDKTRGSSSLIEEQSAREKKKKELEENAEFMTKAARDADKNFQADQGKLKKDRDALDPTTPEGKALQKKIDDAGKKLQVAVDSPDYTIDYAPGPEIDRRADKQKNIVSAQADRDAANAERTNYQKEADTLTGNEDERVRRNAEANDAAKNARDQAEKNADRLAQLPGEIEEDSKKEASEEHTRKVTEILAAHGGRLNESLGQLAAETGKTHEQTLNIVQSIIDGHFTLQQRIAQLEAQLAGSRNQQGGQG
jgi:hypothetical protein